MKWNRTGLILVMGFIFILSTTIYGYSDDSNTDQWILYGTAEDGTQFLYNKTRISEITPKVIQVLEMEMLSQQAKDEVLEIRKKYNSSLEGWDKLSFTAHLREVNCSDKTLRWIKSIEGDDTGKILDSMEYSDKEITSITPGSMGDLLSMAVCPKDEAKTGDASRNPESKQPDSGDTQPSNKPAMPEANTQ